GPVKKLADGSSSDPTDRSGAAANAANAYMMDVYLRHILPKHDPDLSVVWMRNPDSAQHSYGLGTPNAVDALRAQDVLLGKLLDRLRELGVDGSTDIIIVSDHGHSNIAGPRDVFPLRKVESGKMTAPDEAGFSASGSVRLADLMTRAGFAAFDGSPC